MFIILVYDVNVKRNSKVHKICKKYLSSVQRSVFEGMITEGKLGKLKYELYHVLEPKEDQCTIYEFQSLKYSRKEEIGMIELNNNIL